MRLFSASFFLLPLLLFSDANALDLRIETTRRASCKRKTQPGDRIQVHYVGKLAADGTQFGSSFDTNQPFEFQLGTGRVIEGWERGLQDMCIGEKRRLIIPPELGFEDRPMGPIPPSSTLIYDVELLAIEGVGGSMHDEL
ncbi:hypothetical protein VTN31DRAFT_4607 [Thermomyces dupontii]|uniref:uncharacterized protein n=1 Tax=Talaromyces thermophilus TaxID=28565 RepID=UPI003742BE97